MKQLYWLADNEEPNGDTEETMQNGGESPGIEPDATSEEEAINSIETQPTQATPQDTEQPQEAEDTPTLAPVPSPVGNMPLDWQKYAPVIAGVAVVGALIFFVMKKK